jgi:hypothetical protein
LYNRYVSQYGGRQNQAQPPPAPHKQYPSRIPAAHAPPAAHASPAPPPPQQRLSLQNLFGGLKLRMPDRGDLLIMLILLILCLEDGEDLDSLIIIGLVFLLGL